MMMMEPLRRSQNVFVGLFQTGAKMLGLGMGLGGGGGDGGRAKAGGAGAGAGVTSIFLSGPSDGSSSSSNKVSYHNMR